MRCNWKRNRLAAILFVASTAVACSNSGSGPASHSAAVSVAVSPGRSAGQPPNLGPTVPKCAALFGDPDWAKKLAEGVCEDANGDEFVTTGSFHCKDGSKLYQWDYGGASYWGVSSGALMRTNASLDDYAPYRAAYVRCMTGGTASSSSP